MLIGVRGWGSERKTGNTHYWSTGGAHLEVAQAPRLEAIMLGPAQRTFYLLKVYTHIIQLPQIDLNKFMKGPAISFLSQAPQSLNLTLDLSKNFCKKKMKTGIIEIHIIGIVDKPICIHFILSSKNSADHCLHCLYCLYFEFPTLFLSKRHPLVAPFFHPNQRMSSRF